MFSIRFIHFIFQITVLFLVIVVSLVNLCIDPTQQIWLNLLFTSLGISLPTPKIRKKDLPTFLSSSSPTPIDTTSSTGSQTELDHGTVIEVGETRIDDRRHKD